MTKVIFERLHDDAVIPYKAGHPTDAGYDVVATSVEIKLNEREQVRIIYGLGFKAEIPEGYRVKVAPRSSIFKKALLLANSEGTIDSAYRDEWKVIFVPTFDLTPSEIKELHRNNPAAVKGIYALGERIAQVYLEKNEDIDWTEGEVNMKVDREGGLGSTNEVETESAVEKLIAMNVDTNN